MTVHEQMVLQKLVVNVCWQVQWSKPWNDCCLVLASVMDMIRVCSSFCHPLPSSRHPLSYDCLEDRRENYPNCCALCCGFRLRLFLCSFGFSILCAFFWISLDCFVLALFVSAALGLVSSVLWIKRLAEKNRIWTFPKRPVFVSTGTLNLCLSVSQSYPTMPRWSLRVPLVPAGTACLPTTLVVQVDRLVHTVSLFLDSNFQTIWPFTVRRYFVCLFILRLFGSYSNVRVTG